MPNKYADDDPMPREPVHRLMKPLNRFLHVEAASGVVLLVCALVALSLANSPWSASFLGIWKTKLGLTVGEFQLQHSLKHWINDGLMAIFFFVIGLEVKRELVLGLLGIGLVVLMQRAGVRSMGFYTAIGVVIWLGFHESGIHATVAGVVVGMLTPARPYLERTTASNLLRRASEAVHGGTWEQEEAHRAEKVWNRVVQLDRAEAWNRATAQRGWLETPDWWWIFGRHRIHDGIIHQRIGFCR